MRSLILATILLMCCAAAQADRHTIPLFVMPGPGGDPQGVLRLANDADADATVSIVAIDDAGTRSGPATLTLGASAAVTLSATELQSGAPSKGLTAGLGSLSGDVRLLVESDAPITPSAYVRGIGGTLTAMNATVLGAAGTAQNAWRYDVTLFHPAAHSTQPSRLRLVNPNVAQAQVTIEARDDAGNPAPGGAVQLTLPPGGASTLSARQLEAGDSAAFTGQLGAGMGDWRLTVTADRPVEAVHVSVDAAGGWSNLSTNAVTGWAPADAAAFEARFLDRAIVDRDGESRLEIRILAEGRMREAVIEDGTEVITYEGPYAYERAGRDAGRIVLGGEHLGLNLYFASATTGWYASGYVDGEDLVEYWSGGSWWTLDPEATPLDLGAGPDDRTYTLGAAIDVATLPAATGGGELTYSLTPEVPGLSFDPQTRRLSGTPTEAGEYLMTYRVRDAASGDADWRYFYIAVQGPGDGAAVTYETGETVAGLPTGDWRPDTISNARFTTSGDDWTAELDHRGYIEEGNYRYTCQSVGGCTVRNGEMTSGFIARTPLGGGGSPDGDDHGDEAASATTVTAGSDTPSALTAGDVDYFRVEVAEAGTLQAYSSGGTDTYGQLEDADGAVLRRNDDGGAGTNFRLSENVAAGTYYVRVRGYSSRTSGAYTLHMRFSESDTGTTTPPPAAGDGDCRVGLTLNPGDSCAYPGTAERFTVTADGRGRFLFFTSGGSIDLANSNINGRIWDFAASHQGGGVWRIDRIDGRTEAPVGDGTGNGIAESFDLDTAAMDLRDVAVDFYLDDRNDFATGATFANGRFYVVDGRDNKVYAYTASGERDEATDFTLTGYNRIASGIVFANNRFYIASSNNRVVYAYTASGERDEAADFRLDGDPTRTSNNGNTSPGKIVFANGRFYITDISDDKVYAYAASGQRDAVADFDLDDDNSFARGITFANGRFYVVDAHDDKVYAYTASGQRDAASAFYLHGKNHSAYASAYANGRLYVVNHDQRVYAYNPEAIFNDPPGIDDGNNSHPAGIAHANDLFYIADGNDRKVYAYTTLGERVAEADFDLDSRHRNPNRMVFANNRLYIVDGDDRKVYAYTTFGERDAAADFDLGVSSNFTVRGIAFANGRFYVLGTNIVLAFTASGERDATADFDLDAASAYSSAIVYADGRFYVLRDKRTSPVHTKILAYTASGERDAAADSDLANDHGSIGGITYANGRVYVAAYRGFSGYSLDYAVESYPVVDYSNRADLKADSVAASETELDVGYPFTLSAVVHNVGNLPAAATTLRFFRSKSSTISSSATEIGDVPVGALGAGAAIEKSIELTAPGTNDCYYCGACVDSVDDEFTGNNCSANSVAIAVGEQTNLRVTNKSIGESVRYAYDPVYMVVEIVNDGPVASSPTTLRFNNDGRSVNRSVPALAPGERRTFSAVVGTASGYVSAEAVIDYPCDTNTRNNRVFASVNYRVI